VARDWLQVGRLPHYQWKSHWTITIRGKTRCVLLHFDSSKRCICPLYRFLYAFKVVKLFLKHPVQWWRLQLLELNGPSFAFGCTPCDWYKSQFPNFCFTKVKRKCELSHVCGMKAYRGSRGMTPPILTSALDGGWVVNAPAAILPVKNPGTHISEGWRERLHSHCGQCGEEKSLPCSSYKLGPCGPWRSRHSDCTTPAHPSVLQTKQYTLP